MKYLDFFSGIGGFRLGMDSAGHTCLGHLECNPWCKHCKTYTANVPLPDDPYTTICTLCGKRVMQHARKSYDAMFQLEKEWSGYDINELQKSDLDHFRGEVDLITAGFPCNAFSHAGARKGFEDPRGRYIFRILWAAEIIEPRYLFFENVRGLLTHDKGRTFAVILAALSKSGYDCQWQVLNAQDFGCPTGRERLYIVAHHRTVRRPKVFPILGTQGPTNGKIIKIGNIRKNKKSQSGVVYDVNGIAPTLCATGHSKDPIKVRIPSGSPEGGYAYRRLTSREQWRIHGFPDWAYDRASDVCSETNLNFQIGNSVPVPVIEAIGKKLKACE